MWSHLALYSHLYGMTYGPAGSLRAFVNSLVFVSSDRVGPRANTPQLASKRVTVYDESSEVIRKNNQPLGTENSALPIARREMGTPF